MFQSPFSFDGRIRRSEFGITLIIYAVCYGILMSILSSRSEGIKIFGLAFIPLVWFLWAQGAKRCHDLGKSGFWQLIPFYALWMIFQDGDFGQNEYGNNPKSPDTSVSYNPSINEIQLPVKKSDNSYDSSYDGGHNNSIETNESYSNTFSQKETNDGYKSGDLYN